MTLSPQLSQPRRHEFLRQPSSLCDKLASLITESSLDPFRCAKEVRDNAVRRALDTFEEERGPARGDDATVNLCNLKSALYTSIDTTKIAVSLKPLDKTPQIIEHRFLPVSRYSLNNSCEISRSASRHSSTRSL
jgi:hypothetical protein